ncbi:hypothetical protein AVEN_96086-1 [Araneus ventricosus]|uniref:Uncharacterized protein n=1 Tax=Araneus ventricosus TaxID=182803 RepID=A0A4Y2B488_ARAVE|nr:hypothetical protein AVEN_96086-1 [Araneus ventricosus]
MELILLERPTIDALHFAHPIPQKSDVERRRVQRDGLSQVRDAMRVLWDFEIQTSNVFKAVSGDMYAYFVKQQHHYLQRPGSAFCANCEFQCTRIAWRTSD